MTRRGHGQRRDGGVRSWSEPGLQVTWRPSASWGSPGGGRPRRLLAPSTAEAGGCGWGGRAGRGRDRGRDSGPVITARPPLSSGFE